MHHTTILFSSCTFATLNCDKVCSVIISKLLHYMFVSHLNSLFYIAYMLGHPDMAHTYCSYIAGACNYGIKDGVVEY